MFEDALRNAREKELELQRLYDVKTAEYQTKKLKNDEIRRQLQKEEDDLKAQIPEEHFIEDSEWAKVVEEIRVLERLVENG